MGSQHIIECGHDGGDVVEHLQCDEIMCSPYVFPEGVTGSTGSNGCVQNESLSAVTQPVCDLACQSGYHRAIRSHRRFIATSRAGYLGVTSHVTKTRAMR